MFRGCVCTAGATSRLLDTCREWVFFGMFLTFKVVEGVRSMSRQEPTGHSMNELMMAEQQVLTVNGMTCDGCERRIASALDGVSGIDEASADHQAGIVTLQVDPTVAGPDAARSVIEELGYEVVSG